MNIQYIQTHRDVSEELNRYFDQDGRPLLGIGPLSKVNLLVGPTNSGKSRFMRGLAKSSSYLSISFDDTITNPFKIIKICESLSQAEFNITVNFKPQDNEVETKNEEAIPEFFKGYVDTATRKSVNEKLQKTQREFIGIQDKLIKYLTATERGSKTLKEQIGLMSTGEQLQYILELLKQNKNDVTWANIQQKGLDDEIIHNIEIVLKFLSALKSIHIKPPQLSQIIYIPVLRTAVNLHEVLQEEVGDLAEAIAKIYELRAGTARPKIEVFTGNQLYKSIKKDQSSDAKIHKRLKDFQRFLGETFFDKQTVELKPLDESFASGKHLALFLNEQTQRLFHDLGDGIQAIIILMYKLFTAEPDSWFFIEEPEQGLHPGLQRIFLETITNHPTLSEKNLKIFLTTHSNHLLGTAISEIPNVSVFAFQKRENYERANSERFEIRPIYNQQASILAALGVRNTSVFLANCGIWVEGVTDRKYFRAYLKAYLDSDECQSDSNFLPQEDIHYAFFEYAGSNLTHYVFEDKDDLSENELQRIRARFLSNRIFLIADRDTDKEDKHELYARLVDDNFVYVHTPGIEVENLISEEILLQVLPDLTPKIKVEDVKEEKIAYSDYQTIRLGDYLLTLFGKNCQPLVAESGTLKTHYKTKLADLVSEDGIVTWENMSEDARQLTKRV